MLQALAKNLARLRADNPGPMTATGTNCYLLGDKELVLIDPGPSDAQHIEALLAACNGKLKWILATHTHNDHSPGAAALAAKTGAKILGPQIANDDYQDQSFVPDITLADGDRLTLGEIELEVIATPGHVDNHLCYYWPEARMVFSGDHIMQGSSVVIIPPAGDMHAYMQSLEKLLAWPLAAIAPGHGELIAEPEAEIEALIAHRLGREQKVIEGLRSLRQGSLDQLVEVVYRDVDVSLHPIAKLSLWAHLLKLELDGVALVKNSESELADKIWQIKD